MDLQVVLERHVGKQQTILGEVDVDLKQFRVFLQSEDLKKARGNDRIHIGYVGDQPNAPLNLTAPRELFPSAVWEKIREAVRVALAEKGIESSESQMHQPVALKP